MEWTDAHDVLMLREMLAGELFTFKKGTVSRGEEWESIVENLNAIQTPQFRIKDKRAVRDRWQLLSRKYKGKVREEESASGICVEEPEKETLIEELIDKEENGCQDSTTALKEKEDVRQKALETMGQTKARKLSEGADGEQPKKKRNRRCAEPLVDFLQEKSTAEMEIRQQEIEMKRKEHDNQQQMIQTMMAQQQQMNTKKLE